jgi:hypothetical protein
MSIMILMLLALLPRQGDVAVTTVRAFVPGLVAPASLPSRDQIGRAIKVLEAKGVPVSDANVTRYADSILKAAKAHQVDPYLLVAVARVESNFTSATRLDYRCRVPGFRTCSQDCGITQQNFTGPRRWVLARCQQVRDNPDESIDLAARELASRRNQGAVLLAAALFPSVVRAAVVPVQNAAFR